MNKSQKFVKLTEQVDNENIMKIADSYTRFILGDQNIAIKELQKLVGNLKGDPEKIKDMAKDPSYYNAVFSRTYKKFVEVLRGALL